MKRVSQIILLSIAIIVGVAISFFGTDEIANWLKELSGSNINSSEIYPRIVLFLLSTFFAEILIERLTTFDQIDKIEHKVDDLDRKVSPFFARFLPGNRNRVFYELSWKYMLRGVGHQENGDAFTVNRQSSLALWRDCLVEADTWQALSYVSDLWQLGEREVTQAHQKAHIELKGQISRIFVFDDDRDYRNNYDVMTQQQKSLSGIEIKWIIKKDLTDRAKEIMGVNQFNRWKQIELLDFAIVDHGSYVLWFRLRDGLKQLDSATVTVEDDIIDLARSILQIAESHAQELKIQLP